MDRSIMNKIAVGHKNAKTRAELKWETGMSDRDVRKKIEEAKQEYPIINIGTGYFIPDPTDPIDISYLKTYILSENAKANSIIRNIKIANEFLREADTSGND